MTNTVLLKELQKLRGVKRFFDDGLIALKFDRTNIEKITVFTLPVHGFFKNCMVNFELNLKHYPNKKPTLKCLTKIFHPNVSQSGGICFSMFGGHWVKTYTLIDYLNGILFHLNHPNPGSPLSGSCAIRDEKLYAECVGKAACGEKVKGKQYDFCFVDSSRIKDSISFALKADRIFASMNRYKIVAKVNMRITNNRTSCGKIVMLYDLEDLKKEKLACLYDPIFEDILYRNLEKMNEMVDDVTSQNEKILDDYVIVEGECVGVLDEMDLVFEIEKRLATLSNRLVKSFGRRTEIFVEKFKPYLLEMNEIITSRLKNIYKKYFVSALVENKEKEKIRNNSCVIVDNSNNKMTFDKIYEKIEMFENTNKLLFEFLASVELCMQGCKRSFRRFQNAFTEMKEFVEDNLVLIKLKAASHRVSQRIDNLPSQFKASKESKYFLKELIVQLSPIQEEEEEEGGEIEETEGEDDDDNEEEEPKPVKRRTNAIVISNGRNFVDFDALSVSLKSRVEFFKLNEKTNNKDIPSLKSIPFFSTDLLVVFNSDIFNELGEKDMVYFASGSPDHLIGMEKRVLQKYIGEKKNVRIVDMHTRAIQSSAKYQSKNYGFYFDDGTRRNNKVVVKD